LEECGGFFGDVWAFPIAAAACSHGALIAEAEKAVTGIGKARA
jgi:hypothetical protein